MSRILLFLFVLPQVGGMLLAQEDLIQDLQVVTKTIEDTYAYHPGVDVAVEGEKAEIFVETWDRDEINVRLEMVAKHPQIETAREEIENLIFITSREGDRIYLRNKRVDPSKRPESELYVYYYITLPEECPVYLKSHFGAANISNLRNRLRIFGEYTQININNVEGMMDINTRFGDILGERLDGNVFITARRSDVELYDIGGNFTINSQYGELRVSPNSQLADLQINADRSDVYLIDPEGRPLSYNLSSTYGEMVLPDEVPVTELESNDGVQRVRIESGREIHGEIKVSVSFGSLVIEKQERALRNGRRRF
ncbi:MAG: DUF4097 family beta strand repeat-containing protein [Bacteroidota bacterium]